MKYIVKTSYGNDSLAMLQFLREAGVEDVQVIYNDTGWAHRDWPARVERAEAWVRTMGYSPVRISSEGFVSLARRKRGFPRQGMQFCTEELKIRPSLIWLEQNDPERKAIVCVGKRREESAARAATPEFVEASPLDGGRLLWHPIFAHSEAARDALLLRGGWEVLPTRSKECHPCINSNRRDLRLLAKDEPRLAEIETLEAQMGRTAKGAPRTLFHPYRYSGATGIRQIIKWALSERGKFSLDDGTGDENSGCYSGQCGL